MDTVIAILIIAAAGYFVFRKVYGQIKGKEGAGCGCGGSCAPKNSSGGCCGGTDSDKNCSCGK
ncbi:FeoB-associated Cys-rich membrane protein [Pseudodesulfovibrio sp. zrk46]|uniref:FeoB-associated Cys-rich membrane protein n=1 Tax=Pseudodesulfovibrio sp. zrk46 TaxID=2725288 RepID=UPI001449EAEA|nr:FeoB-associated Cys-rich membrane protein [Pseudodesulfovibrio sp. zrk46]QJB56956.1 FeoB-associated Cys-rich membrane protein [Pseudodesulfovibrio sp. zrk46]